VVAMTEQIDGASDHRTDAAAAAAAAAVSAEICLSALHGSMNCLQRLGHLNAASGVIIMTAVIML
jgi:hypothetical protein